MRPPPACIRFNAAWPAVEILHEDSDVLALNKPAGLLVVPDRWDKTRENLIGLLHAGIGAGRPWATERGLTYLANAHRLDAGTSGVFLLARNKPALVNLVRQFHDQHPAKVYTALVQGTLPKDTVEIDLPLAPSLTQPGLSVIDRGRGKPAHTRFSLLERFRGYALIKAEPTTGRLHQIRAHLKAMGCPLVADRDYGSGRPLLLSLLKKGYKMKPEGERPLMDRPALHAERIELRHPATGAPLVIAAPWPKDLTIAVKYLRKFAV
jgi:RluA family pseudouridine synthase